LVLAVAAALENLLEQDPQTARPVPDLAFLRTAPMLREAAGFLGFD
jgi:amidase